MLLILAQLHKLESNIELVLAPTLASKFKSIIVDIEELVGTFFLLSLIGDTIKVFRSLIS
jgi:hypothetical protein